MLVHVYETRNTLTDPLKAVKLFFVAKGSSLHWCTLKCFLNICLYKICFWGQLRAGPLLFTAWKCIHFNFSHQNHKLYVKVKIYSQTSSTNSTNCVQSCIEVYKLNMTWVMLDMDNCVPFPSLWLRAFLGVCGRALCRSWWQWLGMWALGHLTRLWKLNILKWVCSSCDPVLW